MSSIAIVQEYSVAGEKAHNLEKATGLISRAAEQGARLVLFPELYLTGYLIDEKIADLAEEASGPSVNELSKMARANHISVCMGFAELEQRSKKIFNSVACLSDKGDLLTVYRKTHLFDAEKTYFSPGNQCQIVDTPIGRAGFLICYDLEFPEMARMLALQGAEVILVSTANMQPWCDHQDVYVRARAMENQVFLALANTIGKQKKFIFCGNSILVDPMGELETAAISKSRSSEINYLRDRRPSIYQLSAK